MSDKKPRKEPTQARAKKRVAEILAATRRLLREQGLKSVTTNSIAAEAAVPVSSIYQYFPNKLAILVALYEDYLSQVLAAYEVFDQQDDADRPWQDRVRHLLSILYRYEQQDGIENELEKALGLFPELREIDQRHAELTAKKMAEYLKRFGARGSAARLERVGSYLYELNAAIWVQRARYPRPQAEHLEFGTNAALGVLAPCFDD